MPPTPSGTDLDRLKELANRFAHLRYFYWVHRRETDLTEGRRVRELLVDAVRRQSLATRKAFSGWLATTKGEFPKLSDDNRYIDGYRVLAELFPVPVGTLPPEIRAMSEMFLKFPPREPTISPPAPTTPPPAPTPTPTPGRPMGIVPPLLRRGGLPGIPGGMPAGGGGAIPYTGG
jgi:hypothetical protein